MKSVSELLNLLSSNPSEASGLLGGKGTVAPKGPQSGDGSFEDLLSRLTSKTGNAGASNYPQTNSAPTSQHPSGQASPSTPAGTAPVETITTVSETTIAVMESVKASNPQQLQQAEQTLASLTVGVAHLINLMSQLNQGQSQQAQAALKALGTGPEALPGIQNLLNSLQSFLQQLPPQQNPLNLPSDQQTVLLGQLFQQLIQNQQLLLGVAPTAQSGSSNSSQTSTGGSSQAAFLQFLFSETQASQIQGGGALASQVSINLESFKMSATFIQEGQASNSQAVPVNPQALLNSLNQALSQLPTQNNGTVAPTAPLMSTASQNDLNQNFKNLVQLLMQSGVSQAALTTFVRHQQETGDQNTQPGQTTNALPAPANQIQQAAVELPPVNPAGSTVETAINANTAQRQAESAPKAQESALVQASTQATANLVENNLQPQTNLNLKTAAVPALTPQETSTLNNTVNRLNAMVAQVLVNRPGGTQVQPAASTLQPLPEQNGVNPREIAILNDTVVRMNASALHTIQGSIGGNSTAPDMNLTMDQVVSSKFATRLSNTLPPTFGNPSVPINSPERPQPAPALDTAAQATAQAVPPVENGQNTAPATVLSNAAQETPVFLGAGINNTTLSREPINQPASPVPQAVTDLPSVNQAPALNNGVTVIPAVGINGSNGVSSAVAASANPAVSTNPAPAQVTVPNTVVPLPQPTTLPLGANPVITQGNAVPGGVPTFAPGSLNPAVAPPPTSQAPIIPAAAVVGEGVKSEIPATTVPRNENFANPSAVANTQPLSSVIPVAPEAVAPAGTVLGPGTGLGILNATDKNTPNNLAVLEANTLLGLSSAANQPSNTHTTSPAAISTAPGANFDTISLLNQISQQVAAQTEGARAVSRLSFQLIPESLGRVTVQIALVDQSVSARILVTNPQVRENLQSHMVDLRSALNQAGLQIDQLQVQVQGGGANLLAQYYQYQQEGFGYRLPASPVIPGGEGATNPENIGNLDASPVRMSLVDVLA